MVLMDQLKKCEVLDCDRPFAKVRWCRRHYRFNRLYGDPLYVAQTRGKGPDTRTEKLCNKCQRILPASNFKIRPNQRLESWCRECTNLRTRLKSHNLTEDNYNAMVVAQDGKCAICDRTTNILFIDHNHNCCPGKGSCGKCVRGLLCPGCNSAVGALGENPEIFAKALAYLRRQNEVLHGGSTFPSYENCRFVT